ncbi:MAG: ankyrin repeat domain-containing protein [Phycisphaerae bacterium]
MKSIKLIPLALVFICLVGLASKNCPANDHSKYLDAVREFANNAATYYVAIDGNDANPGKLKQPFKTLEKTIRIVKPGDTVYVRSGIYHCDKTIVFDKSGEQDKPIRVCAHENEKPIFDFSKAWGSGFLIRGAYWHLKDLTVENAELDGIRLTTENAHDNLVDNCTARRNGRAGILVMKGAAHNLVANCDSYHNYDPATNGQNADGLGAYWSVGQSNVFRGCRAWNNADDGFDSDSADNGVRLENCYAWANGKNIWQHPLWEGNGNGFKLGSGSHILIRCVAWDHPVRGFKLQPQATGVTLYNCGAFRNKTNYQFIWAKTNIERNVLRNCLSLRGRVNIKPTVDDLYNSWNDSLGVEITEDDFMSLDDAIITGSREPGGSIPKHDFLKLRTDSDAVDAGTDVRLPFLGRAPDLGAFECLSTSKDIEQVPSWAAAATDHDKENRQADSTLRKAVENGQLDIVKQVIAESPTGEHDLTPLLFTAIKYGHVDVAEYLLAQGGEVNEGDWTPLMDAPYYHNKCMVELLISKGADINKGPWTALHSAVDANDAEIVELLIKKGANINAKDGKGRTPQHLAAGYRPNMAEMLIARGADTYAKDDEGRTPLHFAVEQGYEDVTKCVIENGTDINLADKYGATPLHWAARQGDKAIAQLLIDSGAVMDAKDTVGRTPLYYAARKGRGNVAALLVANRANLDIQDKWSWTPLHIAAFCAWESVVVPLLEGGADPNIVNNRGRTALSLAQLRYQLEIEQQREDILREAKAVLDLLRKEGAKE